MTDLMKKTLPGLLIVLFGFTAVFAQEETTATENTDNREIINEDTITDLEETASLLGGQRRDDVPPPPAGLEKKQPLSEKDLKNKREGSYFTGLPLLNSDADTGVGYGARVYWYDNGPREDGFFAYSPYKHRVFAQYFATTGGWEYHTVDWDAPYFMGTLYRLKAALIYDHYAAMRFFGIGSQTMEGLSTGGKSYDSFLDYDEELRKITGGQTNARYNQYEYEKPSIKLSVERELMGGLIRPLAGIRIQKVSITDYTNKKVDVDGTEATNQTTLLRQYQDAGLIKGFDGGMNNQLLLGVAFDTRDFEPDPNSGMLVDLTTEISTKGFGSDFDYSRYTVSPRIYYSPMPDLADLVIAARAAYSVVDGDVPFYAYNTLAFTNGNRDGLGGYRTLRGYTSNRFVGRVMTLANFEIRYTFFDFNLGSQHFALMIVPFVDAGRVFDKPEDVVLDKWAYSYGAGLRIPWNQATIIFADYGISEEGAGLYINFEHIF